MKTLWNAVIAIAIANLLAIGAFVGWLFTSDRLDLDRVRQIRMVLSVTISDQKAADAATASKVEAETKVAEEAVKAAKPPLTAAEKLAARVEATDLDRERASRLRREVESLQQRLAAEADKLSDERARLDADKKEFAAAIASANAKVGDEQFQKSLGILAGLKPAAAKSMLMQMISGEVPAQPGAVAAPDGKQDARLATAVKYLDAMDERPRSKIMAEMAKDDPALATQLLEKLRTRGQVARSPGADSGAVSR
jgi:hypothetical protein